MNLSHLRNTLISAVVISICTLLMPQKLLASINVNCDNQFVKPHATLLRLDVSSTGTDDTENIQCALDAAVQQGIPVVKLTNGNFVISAILVKKFKGSFEGTTRAGTILTIIDNSVDCAAFATNGRRKAAIKFAGGAPTLRYMNIKFNHACIDESVILNSVVHYTGVHWQSSNCKNDNIFGAVDRVDFSGPGYNTSMVTHTVAIEASAEGWDFSNNCTKTLTGTFKVNQSTVTAVGIGVLTSMRAGAQVDVNYSIFNNNRIPIYLVDSNQSTTITGNTFNSVNESVEPMNLSAIYIKAFSNTAPNKTRVVINDNKFNFSDLIEGVERGRGTLIHAGQYNNVLQDISLAITNNDFQVNAYGVVLMSLNNLSNSAITGNTFTGFVDSIILATGSQALEEGITGCLIVGNSFHNMATHVQDVYLNATSTGCIVGPDQDVNVIDSGVGNTIL